MQGKLRVKLVAGNWKMNGNLGSSRALLQALLPAVAGLKAEIAVCPPYPYLALTQQLLQGSQIGWGGQDACRFESGAYTGGVSAAMLADFGCRYAIVGHSERRSVFGDTSEIVALKFAAAAKAGLTPILCVGETLAEREAGNAEKVVAAQLDAVIGHCGVKALGGAVLAYEPVWAIGTGRTATPEQAQAMHDFVRKRIAAHDAGIAGGIRILYGGSVKASNAEELFAMADIDGGLIGGASLQAAEFAAICRAAGPAD
jgi:triosephosphate isomerase